MNENKYKKAIDDVCEKEFTITGAQMLEIAKAASQTERNITMTSTKKKSIIGKIIGTAAACVIVSSTAVSAMGYGPLGDTFRKFFGKDKTTAEIIDDGHYVDINQEITEGIFTVKLNSVTGDNSSPKLLFDVTVNDKVLAEKNDRIQLFAYILDEERYFNKLDEYAMWDAYGEKDPEINNLYHVCMDGASAFMINEEEVITAVKCISFESDPENRKFDYDVNMEYRFTVPDEALKDTSLEWYTGITLSENGIDYNLRYAEYGSYDTLMQFNYAFKGTELAGGETDYYKVIDKFDEQWHKYAGTLKLIADGNEYTVKEIGASYCDTEGEAIEAGTCSTWLSFPSIDYTRTDSIELIAGDKSYKLK